jgi:hypothetical protein
MTAVNGSDVLVKGFPIDRMERNLHFLNGYLHALAYFSWDFIPWARKSNYDILMDTNDRRQGDYSLFISLIEASNLKKKLSMGSGPTTVFCFIN